MAFQSLRSIGIGIVVKYEARNPKLETISNDPDEICFPFHRAGKNSNDQNIIIERLIIGEGWVGLCFGFWTFEF